MSEVLELDKLVLKKLEDLIKSSRHDESKRGDNKKCCLNVE